MPTFTSYLKNHNQKIMLKQFFSTIIITLLVSAFFISGCKKKSNDSTSPVVTLTGPNPYFIQKNTVWNDPGATAFDNVDNDIPAVTADPVNTAVTGLYNVTYTATNSAGNRGTYTRTVYVVDINGYYSNVLDISPYPGGVSSIYNTFSDTMHLNTDGTGIVTLGQFGDYLNGKVYFKMDSSKSLTLPSQIVNCGSPATNITFSGRGVVNPAAPTVIINYTKVVNGTSIIAQSSYSR